MNRDIRDLSFEELTQALQAIDEKPFRAKQIFEGIYQKHACSFDEIKGLPQALRQRLSSEFHFTPMTVFERHVSSDGTIKFLFDLSDHEKVETVLIPTAQRTTVCVSSQAGCKFGCRFCASGIGGWTRNLTIAEILGQIVHAKKEAATLKRPLSHVVFMGTGENFDTYANLMKAIRVINGKEGLNIGARRITISTVGIIPKIRQLANENIQVELAISLHGFNDASRNELMPVNKKYPFTDLIKACRDYAKTTKRQVTFEYILIKDVTCSKEAARELGRHLKGIICKMNLIPYNPVEEFPYQTPSHKEAMAFVTELKAQGIHATIRRPRGKDVAAACGQLRHVNKE
jgi:23S rRNA (adenine2503-C2)-methyltransferase